MVYDLVAGLGQLKFGCLAHTTALVEETAELVTNLLDQVGMPPGLTQNAL
jgi:hypothetical protein